MNKWLMIGLVGCALAIFGYLAYSSQRTKAATMNRGPISVAAVRGAEGSDVPTSGAAGNAVVDYTNSLQDDVALAKKRTDEYNAASKARADAVRKSVAETEAQ
jgi:hypothetical protein